MGGVKTGRWMLELEHGFRVVDVYSRLSSEDHPIDQGPSISPDRLEREMHQAGIVRSVVFPPARPETDYVAANNGVARLSVDRPFVAFARINGTQPATDAPTRHLKTVVSRAKPYHTSPEDIVQYAYDDRFHGFVLDATVDGIPDDDVLEALESVSLPLIVRSGTAAPPSRIAKAVLGRSFPVIVAHFGGYPLDQAKMDEMIDLLEEYHTCYLDTSFVRYRDKLERALLEHPDRVFFGSGSPSCHPTVAVMEILTLDVSEDKLWRAFSKNACRVIDALAPE